MKISARDNLLRAYKFENPEWIPASLYISMDAWYYRREMVKRLTNEFPDVTDPAEYNLNMDETNAPRPYIPGEYLDNWGCVWKNIYLGVEGQVIKPALEDWNNFDAYRPPDFNELTEWGTANWDEIVEDNKEKKKTGRLTQGNGGRLFDRLYFLRGFENLMMDFAEEHPKLPLLIEMLWEHSLGNAKKWLDIGVDVLAFHTDIGTQASLMISPAQFRKYIKPMFKDIFQTARKRGALVSLSSDGNLTSIVDDLIECGVNSHDPQYRACTLAGIKNNYYGKPIMIKLDLDRQMFPFAAPAEIDAHVLNSVRELYRKEGGLSLMGAIYGGDVSEENIWALANALRKYCLNMEF